MAPVSTIAVWFGVRCGFGVLCGLGEGMGSGIVAGRLQRYVVEVKLLSNLVLVLFTTALSVPPITYKNAKLQDAYLHSSPAQNNRQASGRPPAYNWDKIS